MRGSRRDRGEARGDVGDDSIAVSFLTGATQWLGRNPKGKDTGLEVVLLRSTN